MLITNSYSGNLTNTNFLVGGDVATVTQTSDNVLQAGIPIYVNSIGVATANAFMTIFFSALILLGILLFIYGLAYCAVCIARRSPSRQWDAEKVDMWFREFRRSWSLRVSLVAFFPVVAFAFYQWTLGDSWLSVLLSVLLLLAVFASVSLPLAHILRQTRSPKELLMASPSDTLTPFTTIFRPQHTYHYHLYFIITLLKAIFIAFVQSSGLVQASLILATEAIFLVILAGTKPHRTRGADVLSIYLAVTRVVCAGLPIAFVQSIGLAAIPRVVIGIVSAVIFSVAVVIMVINVVINAR